MSTPEQWELAGEIMDQGIKHGSLDAIIKSWEEVLVALKEIQGQSINLKKCGVGRTEDGTLIVAKLVPALREHADLIVTIADQMSKRLGE